MKGIILAGGAGSRLHPLTKITSKQLLPVYDKPMVYYPLSTLMLSGIQDILIITTPDEKHRFEELLGDGTQLGIHISYDVQPVAKGIADAFQIGKDFIGDEACALILGDNLFYGNGIHAKLEEAAKYAISGEKATVFGYYVNDPERFGVVEFDEKGNAITIDEKPANPKSNYAVTGLYFYPAGVFEKVQKVNDPPPNAHGRLRWGLGEKRKASAK